MKRLVFMVVVCVWALSLLAQSDRKLYSIAFYNVENLFDTIPDPGKNDAEFRPYGDMQWNTQKYVAKLHNIARVIGELGRIGDTDRGAAIIGLAEVENRYVLQDLVRQPAIADKDYRIVHYEGADRRGIDVALLYDPSQFRLTRSYLVPSVPFNGDTVHLTRGFLVVEGQLAKSRVCVIVNHWPSRGAESPVRVWAAKQVKQLTDSIARANHRTKIIVMGDLNDDPMDVSVAQEFGARKYMSEVTQTGEFYNPWWELLEDKGIGTLEYRGKWNLFDQILISYSLLHGRGLKYVGCEAYRQEYLIQQDGQYKGSPLRTHGGRTWLNGYSDHLPTVIYLKR
ncbi:MAG: endonuclease/exonuclease/phosphatase family protein [Prevotellaceae bacterium]|jgi:predicted extracellular nuclease|nr:endonuclease/exonuclease/phosphatase family protein [Prevotellaceae bacterium]